MSDEFKPSQTLDVAHQIAMLMRDKIHLESKLALATETLEFYASRTNWFLNAVIDDADNDRGGVSIGPVEGGKRAREALEKIKGDL